MDIDWKKTILACMAMVCITAILGSLMFTSYSCIKHEREYQLKRLELQRK